MEIEEFIKITHTKPIQDDLERVNCSLAGTLGHDHCGVCVHGYPKFLVCPKCKENKV